MSLPSINFLHLTVSEIQPGQTISRRPPTRLPAHPDTMGENNTPTALKGCGVKTHCNTFGVMSPLAKIAITHLSLDLSRQNPKNISRV